MMKLNGSSIRYCLFDGQAVVIRNQHVQVVVTALEEILVEVRLRRDYSLVLLQYASHCSCCLLESICGLLTRQYASSL